MQKAELLKKLGFFILQIGGGNMNYIVISYDTRWLNSSDLIKNIKINLKGNKMKSIYKFLPLTLLIILSLFFILKMNKKSNKLKIGIIQIVEHDSLDKARQGFIDELKNLGYDADFDIQIAGGDFANCMSISQKFVDESKDLVLAIATPCAQSMMKLTKDIPILATAITDFESAGLVNSNGHPGKNLTGTSDLAPINKIIDLVSRLSLNAKSIGILYSTTDPSPQYQADLASKRISELGFEKKIYSVSQTSEIQQITEKLVNEVDALYVPIDKITSSAMPQISKVFLDHGKFVVCAEDSMISKGAAATYGMDYYELGKTTAHQADKILRKEAKIQDVPIEYSKINKLNLNYEIIEKLNLKKIED